MMRSAIRILGLCVALCFATPLSAEDAAPPADPARVAAARDLLEVTGVTKQMDGMVEAMSRGFAKGAMRRRQKQERSFRTNSTRA